MVGKRLVETGAMSVMLLGSMYTLWVRYLSRDRRRRIRASKTGRTIIDVAAFVGTPLLCHSIKGPALLAATFVAFIVSATMSGPELKQEFRDWNDERKLKKFQAVGGTAEEFQKAKEQGLL